MAHDGFAFDVFLSYSSKDSAIVRPIAKRLRDDGLIVWFDEWELRPGDSIPRRIDEGLDQSAVLVLCMSANSLGSDWATVESHTFRFTDPVNRERRFVPLRLDGTVPRASLRQFAYIDWRDGGDNESYDRLLRACRHQGEISARGLKAVKQHPTTTTENADVGIDMGTENIRIWVSGRGIVINEPSVVAISLSSGEMEAAGNGAQELLFAQELLLRSNEHTRIRPIGEGVVKDPDWAAKMLRHFLSKARLGTVYRAVFSVPQRASKADLGVLYEVARRAGVLKPIFVESAFLSAMGAEVPIEVSAESAGFMVVDIGGGTTDIAVCSLSHLVHSCSARMGGNQMDEAIITYLKRRHCLLIGNRTAEQIKVEIGTAFPPDKPLSIEVTARSRIEGPILGAINIDGPPKTIKLEDTDIREALGGCVALIMSAIRDALEHIPPELLADICNKGIVLTGGGALLGQPGGGLERRIQEEIGLRALLADDPLACAILGAGRLLEEDLELVEEQLNRYRR
jgi:rod shape-determining protein MreB